jgi:hypothetical protein
MNWLSHQWFTYWWPSDKGNGPENIQWTVLALLVVSLLLPRVRAFFKRHFESVHDKLDFHHEEMLRQAERHHVAQIKLARENHNAHMVALAKRTQSVKKAPARKAGLNEKTT